MKVLAVAALALVGTSAHHSEDSVTELLDQIREKGDRVQSAVFGKLADIGGIEAYEALVEATDLVDFSTPIYAAYSAFTKFSKDPALAPTTLEFLEKEAFKDRRKLAQAGATWALAYYEPVPEALLEKIVRTHKDHNCRNYALVPLFQMLGQRGDFDSATLILENAQLALNKEQEGATAALKLCTGIKSRKAMLEKLQEKKSSPEWKQLLVGVLIEDTSERVTKSFVKLLKEDKLPASLQRKIIEELGVRRTKRAVKPLKAKLKEKDDSIRYSALVAVTQIIGQDRVWMAKLRAFAEGEDTTLRLAAVQALTELRVIDSTSLLQDYLADPDPRIRSQAVELLASTRSRDSIPIFIERLDQEHGPVGLRIARVLRLITGQDFGFKSGRWRAWWKAEGATFVLPTAAEALELEFARRMKKDAEGRTQSTFYGLPVLSKNVCFVLDTSGSMRRLVPGKDKTTTDPEKKPKGPMRITVAKRELTNVLTALSLKTFANIVLFSSDAFAWQEELALINEEVRAEALEFVDQATANGGTNVYGGLSLAFEDTRIDTIYMLTDGSPSAGLITDPDRLLEEVKSWNLVRRIQIHCISVGRESKFLRDLAAQNGGDYRVAL